MDKNNVMDGIKKNLHKFGLVAALTAGAIGLTNGKQSKVENAAPAPATRILNSDGTEQFHNITILKDIYLTEHGKMADLKKDMGELIHITCVMEGYSESETQQIINHFTGEIFQEVMKLPTAEEHAKKYPPGFSPAMIIRSNTRLKAETISEIFGNAPSKSSEMEKHQEYILTGERVKNDGSLKKDNSKTIITDNSTEHFRNDGYSDNYTKHSIKRYDEPEK